VRESIKDRTASIRDYLDRQDDLHADRATIYRYSITAAQWEAMRLLIDKGRGSPADDRRFTDLGGVLKALSRQIGLGDDLTGWRGFLPRDPQRLICGTWQEAAAMWFQ
jgi:hypothetical protein